MERLVYLQYILENCLDESNGKIVDIPDLEEYEDLTSEDLICWDPNTDYLIENDSELCDYLNEMDIEPVWEYPI